MRRRQLLKGILAAGLFSVAGFGWKAAPAAPARPSPRGHWATCSSSDILADIDACVRMIRAQRYDQTDADFREQMRQRYQSYLDGIPADVVQFNQVVEQLKRPG